MISWLLAGVQNETAKIAYDETAQTEVALLAELSRHGLPNDLGRLVLGYWRELAQLGLRVGCWSHAQHGGEPRYVVSLAAGKSVCPTVEFPYNIVRECPAVEPPTAKYWSLRSITGKADEGMLVNDNEQAQTLTIEFPSLLTFIEHYGYHVLPFETIGIRYRINSNSKWMLLCQIQNRRCVALNSLAKYLDVNIAYVNRSPRHHISKIVIMKRR